MRAQPGDTSSVKGPLMRAQPGMKALLKLNPQASWAFRLAFSAVDISHGGSVSGKEARVETRGGALGEVIPLVYRFLHTDSQQQA